MPKGSQQTGSSTRSAESRAGAAQFPFYEAGLQNAGRIYGDADTYPNYAPATPEQIGGFQNLYNTAAGTVGQGLQPQAYDAYGKLLSGGGQSPATGGYSTLAAGGTGPQQTLDRVVNYGVNNALNFANPMAAFANQAAGGNLGQDQLAAVAQGKYTDAASNPYLRSMADAALGAAERSYQRGTSPETAARFAGGGRYGSGANDAAIRANEESFLRGQGDISNKFYGDEYRYERGQQDTAAQQYDAARRAGLGLGITGLGAAGNLVDQGLRTVTGAAGPNLLAQGTGLAGLDTGFDRSERERQNALLMYPQFTGAQFLGPQQEVTAGTGLQNLTQQAYNAPFERLKQYMQTIGAPSGGASETQPIFGNPLTSTISGLSGAVGLGKELGLGSGLNSLLGGGAGSVGSVLSGIGSGALPAVLAPEIGAAGLGSLAALNAGTSIAPALAAAAAPAAFTIICTELVRQGRMPNTWRLAGMRQFMRYPAIARRGYWVWATPVVAHLRRRPDSCFSKIIERTFNWRAEDLAARNGVKGARRLIRGRLVTAAMVLPSLACGLVARRDYWPIVKDVKI